jgi:hypothetical protein
MRHFKTLEARVPQHAITGDVAVFNIGFDRWLDPDGTFLMIGLAVGGSCIPAPIRRCGTTKPAWERGGAKKNESHHLLAVSLIVK